MRNKYLGTGEPGFRPITKTRIMAAGMLFAIRYDFSVAYKVALSVVVLALAFVFRDAIDFLLILTATTQMLAIEVLNSSLEAICDFLKPTENDKIRAIKDMAAAAVGVSILAWLTVILFEIAMVFGLL